MNVNARVADRGPDGEGRSCRRSPIQEVTSDDVENPQDRSLSLVLTRCQDGRPGVAAVVDVVGVVVTDAAAGRGAVEIGLH